MEIYNKKSFWVLHEETLIILLVLSNNLFDNLCNYDIVITVLLVYLYTFKY